MKKSNKINTRNIVLLAILTAIVIVLQFIGAFIRFGPFSVSLVLLPIVIGAALLGVIAGTWLGLVFGVVVLISGDANAFLAINPVGTVVVVLLKGMLAGLAAGYAYKALSKINKTIGTVGSAIACPVTNTGIFIIGSYVFFYSALSEWGVDAGFASTTAYIFLGMVGLNFVFELALNMLLCPVIIRLIKYGQSQYS